MAKSGVAALFTLPGDPRLRRVLVAYGLSRFTEFAGWLAILLVAYAQGGATLVGIAAFAMQLPAIVLVPLLAGLPRPPAPRARPDADARGRRRLRGTHRGRAVPGRPALGRAHRRDRHHGRGVLRPAVALLDPAPARARAPETSCRPTGGPRSWTVRPSSSGSSSPECSPTSSVPGSCWPSAPCFGVVATLLTVRRAHAGRRGGAR